MKKRETRWLIALLLLAWGGLVHSYAFAGGPAVRPPSEALIDAAQSGRIKEVLRILKRHPEIVNARPTTIEKSLGPRYRGWTALHLAVERDDRPMMAMLLRRFKADPNFGFGSERPLHRVRSPQAAAELIAAGAVVNPQDGDATPLNLART